MIKLFKYDLNSDFESNKDSLNQLDNYVALTEDNQMIHLKPPFKELIINTNNTGTTIFKRADNQDGKETVILENGENTFTDWNYGFYFDGDMKQNQITSFDLTKYDTSNVTNMSQMFQSCNGLTSLDFTNFDTSKVTDMSYMFYYCTNLTSLDVSSFDTSNVTRMDYMFFDCTNLTSLDLSSFNTSKVTDMGGMFSGCNKLTYIKCKQAFKDLCWTNQDTIDLPTAMRDSGKGQWDIVQ